MEDRNNYVLRKLRYALNLKDRDIVKIFSLDNYKVDETTVRQYMEKFDTPSFRPLNDATLERFLNGLITFKRGPKEGAVKSKPKRVLMPESKKDFK